MLRVGLNKELNPTLNSNSEIFFFVEINQDLIEVNRKHTLMVS